MSKREHELVPAHRVLSRSDVNALLSVLNLMVSNLPKILVSDPQAKKLGAKAGDVIEIEREDFGKDYKYYRHVVEE